MSCREKAEAEVKIVLDEGSHKYDFFLDIRDLGKTFQFMSSFFIIVKIILITCLCF